MRTSLILALAASLAIGWLAPQAGDAKEKKKSAEARRAVITVAIADPRRLPGDREQDEWRKPDVLLDFAGITPTMDVLDFYAGGGYYTELAARIVGEHGHVVAYNPPDWRDYFTAEIKDRYSGGRLQNVDSLISSRDDLYLSMDSADVALLIDIYHDFYIPGPNGRPAQDPRSAAALVARAVRKGGVVIVQDHVANPGSDAPSVAKALHRIDPAIVRSDFEAVGLKFEAESTALRNPADDHTQKVFEPGIRHRTDRFIYRFRKPEK